MRRLKKFLGYAATYIAGVLTLPILGTVIFMNISQTDMMDAFETDPLCRSFNDVATPQMQAHYNNYIQIIRSAGTAQEPPDFILSVDWRSLKSIYSEAAALQDSGFHYTQDCIAAGFWESAGMFDEMTSEFHDQVARIIENAPATFTLPEAYLQYMSVTRPTYEA